VRYKNTTLWGWMYNNKTHLCAVKQQNIQINLGNNKFNIPNNNCWSKYQWKHMLMKDKPRRTKGYSGFPTEQKKNK